jgi:hypothetical protein
MAKEGGFFSGSAKKDNRIKNGSKSFFSPSSNQAGQITSATSDLSGLVASGDKYSEEGYNQYLKDGYGFTTKDRIYRNYPNYFKKTLKDSYKMDVDRGYFKPKEGAFTPQSTDTKVALGGDNLGSFGAIGGALGVFGLGLKGIQSAIEGGKRLKENIEKKVNPEANKVSIGDRVGGFLNNVMGISPVAAGTLDANQQVSQVSERPKLNYVNPDAKTMSLSEIGEAFKPKNLFGYKDKFGRFDDPGSPLARDRAETIQRVAQNFNAPIVGDARTIGQIKADQEARMRENAKLRYESFKRGERVQQKSADVTYGTNMLSNPAFGFRDKMTDKAKAQYDQSAKDATEMARTDPSLGNVAMQTFNRISGFFGGPQGSLESIGERQLRLANKEINRPTYQKEAYARKFLGITNEQLKAKNLQRIRANAYARNQAFQNEKAQKAAERVARRLGGNIGTGRDGGFGTGTEGKGLPSNPKGFSGYSRKSSPSTGTGTGTSTSRSRGGISKSTSRGQGGGPSSRSKGGTGTGKGTQGRGGRRGGSTGGSGSSSKGGTGTGRTSTSRKASKASKGRTGRGRSQCDIRTKIDINQLTNPNLIKDDLATVAYFVLELKGN